MSRASGQGTGRRLAASALVCCALVCLAAAPATAKKPQTKAGAAHPNLAGRLDPSFGKGGKAAVAFPAESAGDVGVKYALPFQFSAGHLEMALAPGGKVVVAGSTKIVRFLANGKLDPSFGEGGSIAVARPPGMSFVLAAAAVDSQGRVLLAGSARPQPADSTPDPLISSAMVMRFAADGSIDRGFGSEGTLISNFGIEPPKIGPNRYKAAAVGLRSLVVDSQDRPLLTGGYVAEINADCYEGGAISTAFVARLNDSGALDPGFGDAGLRQIADLASFGQLSFFPAGGLLAVGAGRPHCAGQGGPPVVLTGFNSEGTLDPGFGFSGFRAVGFPRAPVATVAPSGKIVLIGAKRKREQLVMRLLPNGASDPSFGRVGRVRVILPKGGSIAAVAVDGRGRLLFAGRISKRISKSPKNPLQRSSFLLSRMDPEGNFDRSFGRRGSVATGFGGPANSFATQVMLDAKGRILVGGGISTSRLNTGGGYAIARYLGGH